MAISSIQLGQVWQLEGASDTWLVTKVYKEVFATYAVLRKVGGAEGDVRRVKVEKVADGVALPGFKFAQDADAF